MARAKKDERPRPPGKFLASALGLLAIAGVVYVAVRLYRAEQATGWNLVLVSVDTLRADHLSSYGATLLRTTHMDRLASEGVLYENVSTVAPTTLPSHASLFTGLTPLAHGVHDNVGFYLGDRPTTLAEHLKGQGYDTAAFVGAFVLDSRFGLDRGFDRYDDDVEGGEEDVASAFVAQRRGEEVLESALAWLGSRGETARPFFAFIHFYDPHTPYEASGGYRAEVAYVDSLVGRLLAWLEERHLEGRTVIALTADHGESLGEHGEATHGLFLYESTLRIPLIVRYPGAPAGKRIPTPTHITAVASEVLDVLRLPPMPGGGPDDGRPFYAETLVPRLYYGWSELRSLTLWPHKLVMAPRPELYDLSKDPGETKNLIEELPEVARALEGELETMVVSRVVPQNVDGETLERLKSRATRPLTVPRPASCADQKTGSRSRVLNDPAIQSLGPRRRGVREGPLGSEGTSSPRASYSESVRALWRALAESRPRERCCEIFQVWWLSIRRASKVIRSRVAPESRRARRSGPAFGKAIEIDPRNTKTHLRLADIELARETGFGGGMVAQGHGDSRGPGVGGSSRQVLLNRPPKSARGEGSWKARGEGANDALAAYNLGQPARGKERRSALSSSSSTRRRSLPTIPTCIKPSEAHSHSRAGERRQSNRFAAR
jgi:hypothetical protein